MTDQLEEELRRFFAAEALKAPPIVRAPTASPQIRAQRLRQRGPLIGIAATVIAAAMALPLVLHVEKQGSAPQATQPPTSSTDAGAVDFGVAGACATYSPERAAGFLNLAFDGVITSVGEPHQNPANPGNKSSLLTPVTFSVNEWFRGNRGTSIVVEAPSPPGGEQDARTGLHIGTRLLVGARTPSGASAGTIKMAICGFTRYYDATTADQWRIAFQTH